MRNRLIIKRLTVVILVLASVPVVSGDVPPECKVPDEQLTDNEQKLCQEIRIQEREIQNLNASKTEVEEQTEYWKDIEAWNNDTQRPAVWIVKTRDEDAQEPDDQYGVFQYVGAPFGDVDLDGDGVESWKEVPIRPKGKAGFGVIIVEPHYTVEGVNSTLQMPQSNAENELRAIGSQFNNQDGFVAWQRWRADQETKKGQIKSGVWVMFLFLIGASGASGIYIESRSRWLTEWLEEIAREKNLISRPGENPSTLEIILRRLRR